MLRIKNCSYINFQPLSACQGSQISNGEVQIKFNLALTHRQEPMSDEIQIHAVF